VGAMECGGPIDWPGGKAEHSSWNPDGRGAQVRRAMFKALDGKDGFLLRDSRFDHGPAYVQNYAETLCRSVFALCPRGYGRTSFRMYEAMQLGAIPVYIYDGDPWLPFNDALRWSDFCMVLYFGHVSKSAKDFGLEFALRYTEDHVISEVQARLKEVVDAYFNLKVAPKRIAELVERVSR